MKNKILWAEDDFYAINGLFRPLEKKGFKIYAALSAIECYRQAQKWELYDIIVVDLILPLSLDDEDIPDSFEKWIDNLEYSGAGLVMWLIKEMKVNCPILILSVVDNPLERFGLSAHKSIHFLSKKGLLPSKVTEEVLNLLTWRE